MGTTVIMQARMGSSRLPGKILMDIGRQPAIALELSRIERANVDEVVVATSDGAIDDPVAELATSLGYGVFRGSELDVLGRFVQALDAFPNDTVIRTTGDCPFIDPAVIDDALVTFHSSGAAYCSNTLVRTFPVGLDCEIMTADVIREADANATDTVEREHVTPYIYRRPERFELAQHVGEQLLGRERWTLDTPEDLAQLQHMATLVPDPVTATWLDYFEAFGAQRPFGQFDIRPDISVTNPATRRWLVELDSKSVGSATLVTQTGSGQLTLDVADERKGEVEALVRTALRSDRQVQGLNVR